MVLFIGISCLFLLSGIALGNLLSGPYQAVYFYEAYRLDVMIHKGGSTQEIATGCKGSGPYGSCNFGEFLEHIAGGSDKWPSKEGPPKVSPDDNKALEDVVEELRRVEYPSLINNDNLYPSEKGKLRTFNAVYDTITEQVEHDTLVFKSSSLRQDEAFSAKYRDILGRARDAMAQIQKTRQLDSSRFLKPEIEKRIAEAGLKDKVNIQYKTLHNPELPTLPTQPDPKFPPGPVDWSNIQEVDIGETINKNGAEKAELQGLFDRFASDLSKAPRELKDKDTKKCAAHELTAQKAGELRNRLENLCLPI